MVCFQRLLVANFVADCYPADSYSVVEHHPAVAEHSVVFPVCCYLPELVLEVQPVLFFVQEQAQLFCFVVEPDLISGLASVDNCGQDWLVQLFCIVAVVHCYPADLLYLVVLSEFRLVELPHLFLLFFLHLSDYLHALECISFLH